MNSDKKIILVNAITTYIRLATGIVVGIFLMRAVFRYLSSEEYGFWVILWSAFGYAIFMDFGFGFSMEKFIPKYLVANENEKIIEIINTVFFCVLAGSLVVVLATLVASNYLGVFKFQNGQVKPLFKTAFILFGILTAIRFSFGLFQEVLVGLHKMYIKDLILAVFDLCSLTVALLIVHLNKGFLNLIIGILTVNITAELTCLVFVMRQIHGFKLSFRYFNKKIIKNVISFSLYTYIAKCASVITGRIFQLIIPALISVTSVGIYQVASRLSAFVELFAKQAVPAIIPYASKLEAEANTERMKNLIYSGTKFVMFLVIPTACCGLFFNRYILTLWLGKLDPQIFFLVAPLLITVSLEILYHVSIVTFIMHGGQKKVARIFVIRMVVSVGAGIFSLITFGLNGLAWSYLICSIFIYLFMFHPEIAKLCDISFLGLFIKFIRPHLISASGLLIFFLTYIIFFSVNSFASFFIVNSSAFFFYAALFYIFALDNRERKMISSAFAEIKRMMGR